MAVPVSAEHIFTVANIPVTNSIIYGWVAMAVFVVVGLLVRRPKPGAPRGIQNVLEALIEFMLSFMDMVTNDRARSKRFFPLVGTLFLFILVSNYMGLLPIVGSIGIWGAGEHGNHLIPLFRPATSDLNATLAMGITAVIASHLFGVATIGFFKYGGKFIQLEGLWKAVKGFGKKKFSDVLIDIFVAVVELGVGLIELVSEVAKVISLSLRLFGNIFAGEVLLHVLTSLVAYFVPVPFYFMELIVGAVQALVFSMLTLVYLTIATEKPHGHEAEEHSHEAEAPKVATIEQPAKTSA